MFVFGIILLVLNFLVFVATVVEGTFDLGLFLNSIFIALALIIGT